MTEKEFYKFKTKTIELFLNKCLKLDLMKRRPNSNKNLNNLASIFDEVIEISFEKGELSAYKDSRKTFKDKFFKNFGVRI